MLRAQPLRREYIFLKVLRVIKKLVKRKINVIVVLSKRRVLVKVPTQRLDGHTHTRLTSYPILTPQFLG